MVHPNYKFVNHLSSEELNDLVKSVDTVLFDVDGVLLNDVKYALEGSDLAIEKLRNLGKKIGFVTENSVTKFREFQTILAPFKCNLNEVVTPFSALLHHLKEINFQKDIYVIASENVKELLREAGYSIITQEDIQSEKIESLSNMHEFIGKTLKICKNVALVIIDQDLDYNSSAIQAAVSILDSRDNILFFAGCYVDYMTNKEGRKFIASKRLIDNVERWTNKKSVLMGKCGNKLADLVKKKFEITDSRKVLMVGDRIDVDVLFGARAGFQTLFVLTGAGKKEDLFNINEFYPDYVAQSVAEFGSKIK